jgi:acyl-CoA thioester hydrolase
VWKGFLWTTGEILGKWSLFMKKLVFDLDIYTFQIDFANHVSNIVYIKWMEIGRTKLLEAVGLPIEQLTARGIAPVLARTEIAYKEPLYLGDRVRIEVWILELRRASAQIAYRFYKDGDVLAAEGSQKGLFIHLDTKAPYRMGADMRARFLRYSAEQETAR